MVVSNGALFSLKMEELNEIHDAHTHILNDEQVPAPFFYGRIPIEPDSLKILEKWKRPLMALSSGWREKYLEKMAGIDLAQLLNVWFSSTNEQWQYLRGLKVHGKHVFCKILNVFPVPANAFYSDTFCQALIPEAMHTKQSFLPIKAYPPLYGPIEVTVEMDKRNPRIWTHCSTGGIQGDMGYTTEDAHPLLTSPTLDKHKNTKFLFCHAGGEKNFFEFLRHHKKHNGKVKWSKGGNWTSDIYDLMELYPENVYVDTSNIIPETDEEKELLRYAVEVVFRGRICYGSDFPLCLVHPLVDSYEDYFNLHYKALAGSDQVQAYFGGNLKLFISIEPVQSTLRGVG